MGKGLQIIIVVALVIVLYLFMLVIAPITTDLASGANTTMAATSNMTDYPGTGEFMLAMPWIMFLVPGAIGICLVVLILKAP